MKLEKAQRNQVFEAIVASGLDPSDCRLSYRRSLLLSYRRSWLDVYPLLRHLPSKSYFKIKKHRPNDSTEGKRLFKTDDVVSGGPHKKTSGNEWIKVLQFIREWAEEVRMPDFWRDLRAMQASLAEPLSGESTNTPFTLDEQKQIEAQVQAIKKQVSEDFDLPREQMERVEEKLDEAAEASKRMGRKDWLLLFGGTIFNLIITDTVTPSVAQHIFTVVISGLSHLFTGGSQPPQILA